MSGRLPALCAVLLAGCATQVAPPTSRPAPAPVVRATPPPAKTQLPPLVNAADKDGFPAQNEIPADVASVPDAVPVAEPRSDLGNPDSYTVYGQRYVILQNASGYSERGYASWYGKKFQGKRTSSGEAYDMFKMTGAHKTLPIPCYVRVTNLNNNRSVTVRINDRGPFHDNRIIDLSYAAALKLGMLGTGEIPVLVESLDADKPVEPPLLVAHAPPAPQTVAPVASRPAVVASLPPPGPPPPSAPATAAIAASPAQTIAPQPVTPPPLQITPALESRAEDAATPRYVQAGLFVDPINAVALREHLGDMGITNVQLKSEPRTEGFVHRVLIGPFNDLQALEALRTRLLSAQMPAVPVVE